MASPSNVKKLQFADESAFAEYAASPGSASWTTEIPIIDCRWSPSQTKIDNAGLVSRQSDVLPGFLGPREGDDLEIDVYAIGHGTATTGALTANWLYTLLKNGLGGGSASQDGGTITGASSTTSLTSTDMTALAGGILVVGVEGDGRAEGYSCVTSSSSSAYALYTALPGTPTTGTPDAVRAALMVYPDETGHVTQRFLYAFPATGMQFCAFGCQLAGLSLKSVVGQIPVWTLKYKVAFWSRTAITSALTLSAAEAAIFSGGQHFVQTTGTTTRNVPTAAEVQWNFDLGLVAKPSASLITYQTIGGWESTHKRASVSYKVEWETAAETLFDLDGGSTTYKQILTQFNRNASGRGFSIYAPRAFMTGKRPTSVSFNGLQYVEYMFTAREHTVETNALTRSNFRIGIH